MNQTDRYRLLALIELARSFPDSRATADVAARREIPPAYLSRLLAELTRAGWVRSRRGPGGGVTLARPPETIPVAAVLDLESSDPSLPPGLDRLARAIDDAVARATAEVNLADLVRWERQATITHDYSI